MFRYRRTRWRGILLWACVLSGGAALGAAGLLWLELQLVHHMREEVAAASGFERWAGKVLFRWRPVDEQLAMAFSEIPVVSLHRTELAARWLAISGLGLAVLGPVILRWRWRS